jgi:cell division transport system permease protein
VVEADDTPEVVDGPIVSPDTVAGRGLTVVVAIMTFLCALLVGAVVLVDRAADAWGAEVMTQVSVTVLPRDGEPTARRLEEVAAILESTEGLSGVRIVPARRSEALLEPWLGTGVDLSLLPVPRLVIAERSGALDTAALAAALSAVPGASLDDHTGWSERLAGMASAAAGGAIAALGLMLAATVISIVFATRSTIATNAATVEVLHILGAEDRFVIRAFRRRFLLTGIRGAVVGLSAALALFGALDLWSAFFGTARASPQAQALFGDPSIGLWGYLALCLVAAGVAGLVALTSTLAVRHHLARLAP